MPDPIRTGDAVKAKQGVPKPVPLTESQERPGAQTLAEDVEPKMLYPSRLEVGDQIPGTSYRILQWIGEGAAGVVYRCEHVELERPAALKILRPDVAPDSRRAQLFRAEAKVASRSRTAGRDGSTSSISLGSPYVVDVFDFGELPDGRMWFAMELLEGHALAKELGRDLDGNRWPPSKVIGVLRQVCKGLGAAHDAGFIHRDVKPHNIMLVKRGSRNDHVKLVDFGVAAAIERGRDDEFLAGTPHYMAPEQAKGADYDQRLDVYGLGCVAYRMLTGRPPFLADSVMALLRMHREEAPVPPQNVPGCEDIPKPLGDAILKALAKEPGDRYPTMAEFEAALCEAQIAAKLRTDWDHLPLPRVDSHRVARLERAMPKPAEVHVKRSPWLLAIAAALVLAAGATAIWALARTPETEAQRDQIDQLVEVARTAGARAYYVYPPKDEPGAMTAYRAVLEMEAVGTQRADETSRTLREEFGETLARLGDVYWEKPGGKPFSADYYAQALLFDPQNAAANERNIFTLGELATLREAAKSGDFSETNLRTGEVLVALATPDEAQREEKLQAAVGDVEARAASTQANLAALVDAETNDPKPKKNKGKRATPAPSTPASEVVADTDVDEGSDEATPPRSGGQSKQRAKQLAKQGQQAQNQGQRREAENLFTRALAGDGNNTTALAGMCRLKYDQQQFRSAIRFCQRAVKASPRNAGYRIRLGDAYYKEFRLPEAREQYLQAKKLGSTQADHRLEKVAKRLGK